MCGIAGFVHRGALTVSAAEARAKVMCDRMAYRGPDEEGYFADGQVALGMKRLSIIDLRTGHQPMFAREGRLAIVYNGEVYNFAELRRELARDGVVFHTASDTEVVLRLYDRDGPAALARLTGMFGIAFYDAEAGTLRLARDAVGIKPLYYYWDGQTFAFGSEIKAVLEAPGVRRELNPQAIWDYLTYEYVPGPQTMFRHLYRIPPGHTLELDVRQGAPRLTPYRDYPLEQDSSLTLEGAVEAFDALLVETVRSQMVADVPVGVLLSGGLDSTAVAVAAQRAAAGRLKTFCIGFREGTLTDETVHARGMAAFLGTDHHEYITNAAEYLGFIGDFVHYMDEPNADMAAIGKYFASRLAAEHVKVVLSGEGGDEMLAGYRLHEAMRRFEQLRRLQRLPAWLARDIPAGILGMLGRRDLADRVRTAFIPLRERGAHTLPSMTRRFTEAEKGRLLRQTPDGVLESARVLRDDFIKARSLGPLAQIQYVWSKQWMAEHLLMQADRMSMCCSIELRVPLLDNRVADFLFRLPDDYKIRRMDGGFRTKYLLRRFLQGKVPAEVLTRPKRGFQIPNTRFVAVDLRDEIRAALTGADARTATLFEPSEVRAWLAAAATPREETACQRVWILYMLERWCRRWMP